MTFSYQVKQKFHLHFVGNHQPCIEGCYEFLRLTKSSSFDFADNASFHFFSED